MKRRADDFVLVGVGGQGVVLAANLLARAFLEAGFDVKQSEVHGMAQRGGSVQSFVRRGEIVRSPVVEPGCADILIAFEELEALRYVDFVREDGLIIVSREKLPPLSVTAGKSVYPEDILPRLQKRAQVIPVNARGISEELGNVRMANTVMMGALSALLDLQEEAWQKAIRSTVKYALNLNIKAFEAGRSSVSAG
ncbi:MAG: indolepyruvate oxidoreductase subunit beta [Bacillota bacterium]